MKVGFFGKLPSHGDFVQRNVSPPLCDYWDNWIKQGFSYCETELGKDWQATYYTAPIWRFCLPSGLIASNAISGLMMPSVDASGRLYPMTVFCELTQDIDVFSMFTMFSKEHRECSSGVIELLQQKRVDLDDTQQACERIYNKLKKKLSANEPAQSSSATLSSHQELYRFESAQVPKNETIHNHFIQHFLAQQQLALSIWAYDATEKFNHQVRYYQGMPHSSIFASLLSGT